MFKSLTVKGIVLLAITLYVVSILVVNLVFDFSDIWESGFKRIGKES